MNAATNSITIQIASIGLGKGKYDAGIAAAAKITLTEQLGTYPLTGGSVQNQTMRSFVAIEPNFSEDIFELGLFLADGTLFAVASTTGSTPLFRTVEDIVAVITIGVALADIDASVVTVSIDPNTAISTALLNQHIAHGNPHPQYLIANRSILTNNGLTGGGDLSQDRTIGIAGLNTTNGLTTKYLSQKGTWENLASDSTLSQFSVDLRPSTTTKQPIDNNNFYRTFNYDVRLTINQPSLVKMQSILESIYRQLMAKSTTDNVNTATLRSNLRAYSTNLGVFGGNNGIQFERLPNAYDVATTRLQDLFARVGGFDIRTSNGAKPIELIAHFNSKLVNDLNVVNSGNSVTSKKINVMSSDTDFIYVPAGTTFDLNISLRFRLETRFYVNEAIPYFRFDIIGLGGELAAAPTVSYGALGQGLTSFDASGDSTVYYPPAPIDFRVSFLDYTMNSSQKYFDYIETDANGVHRFNLVTPKLPSEPGVLADNYSGTISFGSSQAGFIHGPSDTMTVKITSPDGAVVHTQDSSTNPATLGNSIQVYLKASSNGSSAQHSYAMQVFVSGVLKVSANFQPIQGWEISRIVMN